MSSMIDTVRCADALESLKALPDASVDLVITSPPYNIGKEYEQKRALTDYLAEQSLVLRECHRVLRTTGSLLWQIGAFADDGVHVPLDVKIFPILEELGMIPRNRIIWIRPHGVHARKRFSCRHETLLWFTMSDDFKFNLEPIRVPQKYQNKTYWKGEKHGQLSCDPVGKNPGDVWAFRNVKHNHEEQTIHPCQFPEDMIERVVLSTTDLGDVVLDPYVGSGTTAVVAKRLGRRYIGFDADEDYVAAAAARLSGEPDPNGNFPNLRALREYAERKGLSDVSSFRFTRQVGKVATTRDKAKIYPEQMHLTEIVDELETQASESAYRRASRLQAIKS
jgi:adenine-specific DNA-methyltransferase